jgi:hypothetical protein
MKLISHRGNINGRILEVENHPDYINDTICLGYDVEIDVWMMNEKIFLGHDNPQYEITIDWITDRSHCLWVHCKNIEVLEFLNKLNGDVNYFWHEEDTVTLTSKNYIWAYPGKQPIKNSIAVMPEIKNDNVDKCLGVCSDYIENYKIKII